MAYEFLGLSQNEYGDPVAVMQDDIWGYERFTHQEISNEMLFLEDNDETWSDRYLPLKEGRNALDAVLSPKTIIKKERPINEPTPSQERALLWAQQGILGIGVLGGDIRPTDDDQSIKFKIGTVTFSSTHGGKDVSKTFLTVSNPGRASDTQMAQLTQRVADIMGHRTVYEGGPGCIVAHPGAVRNFRRTGYRWQTPLQIMAPRR